MKRIAVLGATGSVGLQALEVIRAFPDKLKLVGLAAHTNNALFARLVDEFNPMMVSSAPALGSTPAMTSTKAVTMEEMASDPDLDAVVIATAGSLASLPVTLAAIKAGNRIIMANHEVLLMAGPLLMEAARKHNATLLPGHGALNAVWQCLHGEPGPVKRVILTAQESPPAPRFSGVGTGAIRQEADTHPSWRMGRKAGADAMTLMNAGTEAILVSTMFGIPHHQVEVILHPEGVVRALVEYTDGSLKAVFSPPTHHLALQYALSYPERWPSNEVPFLDLAEIGRLTFSSPDPAGYPCLASALTAGKMGGTAPAALNAANEVAVLAYLGGQIGLNHVPEVIASVLHAHSVVLRPSLDDIVQADAWAREEARRQTVA